MERQRIIKTYLLVISLLLSFFFLTSCEDDLDKGLPKYLDTYYVFAISDNDADGSYAYMRLEPESGTFILIQHEVNPEIIFRGKYSYDTTAFAFTSASGDFHFTEVVSNNESNANALMTDAGQTNEYSFYWYLTEKGEKRIELQSKDINQSQNLFNGRAITAIEFDRIYSSAMEEKR